MIANPRVVGIQVRTPSHNDVVESRLSRRYDGLPDAAVQKVTLKALVERAVLYPFGSSGDTTKRRRALARRFPLTYLSACARALVMLLIARARLAFVLPAARGALERLHDTGKGMLH